MADRARAQEDSDYNSARISETSRYVGFGLLAAYYAIKVTPPETLSVNPCVALTVGVCGAFTVLLDYLHYAFGYYGARAALKDEPEHSYARGLAGACFALKTWCFVGKQLAAVAGSIALVILIFTAA
jgi:hypothetical protein